MAIQPPNIHTYHCICSTLLLSSTHRLSSLPRRQTSDNALILPLPSQAPLSSIISQPSPPVANNDDDEDDAMPDPDGAPEAQEQPGKQLAQADLPPSGYTIPLGINPASKLLIVRSENGFEKRLLWRCARCSVVIGYEICLQDNSPITYATDSSIQAASGAGKGGREGSGFEGKVLYVLPNGLMSSEFMTGKDGQKIGEDDVDIKGGAGAFE